VGRQLATASSHPLAQAVALSLADAAPSEPAGGQAARVRTHAGRGVTARVDDTEWALGSAAWLAERGTPVPAAWLDDTRARGLSVVALADAERVRLAWGLADTVRADASLALQQLRQLGVRLILLSGDHADAVQPVARQLDIAEWHAGVSVQDKADRVQSLRDEGLAVGMAGDGINDALALASATVSFSR
jgi:Cu+-exporting ATPase